MSYPRSNRRIPSALAALVMALPLLSGCASQPTVQAASSALVQKPVASANDQELDAIAAAATSQDPAVAAAAIARLREAGPPGLDALFRAHGAVIGRLIDPRGPATDPEAVLVREALVKVARQHDVYASQLYWYTDLEAAKRAAREQGKPILSLRLLGNLDEELSCANSRFFRTALYPNAAIGQYLRSSFILHWKSERPAPRVTIDFGDGRKLERTVTGNSVHYVLDSQGRVLDALPGMYGPAAFLRALRDADGIFQNTRSLDGEARRETLRGIHATKRDELASAWAQLLGIPGAQPLSPRVSTTPMPGADVAVPTAVPKAVVETPIVASIQSAPVIPLPDPTNSGAWSALLERHAQDARLDERSRTFMRSKIASDVDLTGHKIGPLSDATFQRKLSAFERAIAEDTVRNEYGMHRVLHEWMALTPPPEEMESFNQQVYSSLFLTPRSDPWLGLLVKDGYSGIQGEGVRLSAGGR